MVTSSDFKIPDIDYTSRDFISIRDDMINRIPFFTEEWTDHNPIDFGIVLVELLAMALDALHFNVDMIASEGFLPTAVTKKSVIDHLKLIDYRIPGPNASTVDLKFTLNATELLDVLIPKNTVCQTIPSGNEQPVTFETISDLTIIAGNLFAIIGAEEGQTFEENFTSNGQSFQKFFPGRNGILQNTIQVFVTETIEEKWTEISTFGEANAIDKSYITDFDENNKATIQFGDGGQGKIPINNSNIRIIYKVGGGITGNVGANSITSVVSTIIHNGNPLSLNVNNDLSATGGSNGQTIQEAKIQGPLSLRTLNRAVTLQDIETLSKQVNGVGKAKARQLLPVGNRIVEVLIAPNGGGQPSNALLQNVLDFLEPKRTAGTIIIAGPPVYIKTIIAGKVFVFANQIQNSVKNLVESRINNYFDFTQTNINFGKAIRQSDIYRLIDETDGVNYVDITEMHFEPTDTIKFLTWSGDTTFEYISFSNISIDEIFTITFFTTTQFNVIGNISGLQINTGVIDTIYNSDNGEIQLKIKSNTIQNSINDKATFRSSKLVNSIVLLPDEIPTKGTITLTYEGGS